MNIRQAMRWGLGGAVAVAGIAAAQDLAATLDALKAKLNQESAALVDEYQTQRVGLEDEYLQTLRKVETDFQTNGWLRGSMALYDERKRFTKTRLLPPPPPPTADIPPELRSTLEGFRTRFTDAQLQHSQKVVALFETYLKILGELTLKNTEYQAQELIAAERERVLDLPAARTAVSNLLASTAAPAPARGTVRAAPEIPADAEVKSWQLYRPQNEPANITMGLDLELEMISFSPDLRVSKSASYYSSGRTESGDTWFVPRVRINARNASLAPDSKLVIDYYSRSLTDTERYREKTDTIALPLLEKGMTFSVMGQGLNVYRSVSQSFALRSSTETVAGKRFHGVVITILNGDGTVLMRRFSPQGLVREAPSSENNGGASPPSP